MCQDFPCKESVCQDFPCKSMLRLSLQYNYYHYYHYYYYYYQYVTIFPVLKRPTGFLFLFYFSFMFIVLLVLVLLKHLIYLGLFSCLSPVRQVHLLRVFLLRVLESSYPGDSLSNYMDMIVPTP